MFGRTPAGQFTAKLMLVLAGLLTALCAALTGASYWMARSMLEEQARNKLQQLAVNSIYDIDRLFFERLTNVRLMATDPVLRSRDSSARQIAGRLRQFKEPYPDYFSISFFDMNRIRIADTRGRSIGRRHGDSEYWPAIEGGEDAVMIASFSESGEPNEAYIHLAVRVKDAKGASIGVLVARVPTSSLAHAVHGIPGFSEEERRLFQVDIVDRDGLVLFSNYEPKRELLAVSPDWAYVRRQLSLGELAGTAFLAEAGEAVGMHSFATESGYRDYRGSGWCIIFNLPERAAFKPAARLRNKMIAVAAVIELAGLLAAFFAASRLSRRYLK